MCGVEYKRCFKCGVVKPLSEFYRHPQMKDGHLGKCKECTRRDVQKHRKENPANVLRTRLAACKKSPTHKNAYMAVEAAIHAGVLTRPSRCSGCGCSNSEHRIEAHHADYTKPLDVIWLCTPCHSAMDARRRVREGKQPHGRSKANDRH